MPKEEIVLANRGRRKGVGFDQVGAGLQIVPMDLFNDLRLGNLKQLVVALEILAIPITEPFAPELHFTEFVPLNHRAHRTIDDGDALFEQVHKPLTSRPCFLSDRPIQHGRRLSFTRGASNR